MTVPQFKKWLEKQIQDLRLDEAYQIAIDLRLSKAARAFLNAINRIEAGARKVTNETRGAV